MGEQTFSPAEIRQVESEYAHSDWRDGVDLEDLSAAISEFQRRFPGWGYSLSICSVSADCTMFPDRQGQEAHLLKHRVFDDGFHIDVCDGTQAEALRYCMEMADQARKEASGDSSS